MGRLAIHPSAALANLMRERRYELGLSLREVQRETEAAGTPIPYATLSKVEQGKVDPGVKRLHVLMRIYRLPVQLAADLLEIEDFAGTLPPEDTPLERLRREGVEHWRQGRLQEGMACLLAVRERQGLDDPSKLERHEALLSFAIAAKNLGKVRLAHQIAENVLLEKPDPELLINALVLAATCWHQLGSSDAALGLLMRAEACVGSGDHGKRGVVFHEKARIELESGSPAAAEKTLEEARVEYEKAGNSYGLCQIDGLKIVMAFERSNFGDALARSMEARKRASEYGFDRLAILRSIDEGRARLRSGMDDEGLALLQEALGKAVAGNDHVLAFHGHQALWKAYMARGELARADLELSAAEYYGRFVDEYSPEVAEVRRAKRASASTRSIRRRVSGKGRSIERERQA